MVAELFLILILIILLNKTAIVISNYIIPFLKDLDISGYTVYDVSISSAALLQCVLLVRTYGAHAGLIILSNKY